MELVLDANILMSALVSTEGKTAELLFDDGIILFAPEYILTELEKHGNEILEKSGLKESDFRLILALFTSRITLIPFSEYKAWLSESENIVPDINDAAYFALALKLHRPLWSNDKLLKTQSKVEVLSTVEVLRLSS